MVFIVKISSIRDKINYLNHRHTPKPPITTEEYNNILKSDKSSLYELENLTYCITPKNESKFWQLIECRSNECKYIDLMSFPQNFINWVKHIIRNLSHATIDEVKIIYKIHKLAYKLRLNVLITFTTIVLENITKSFKNIEYSTTKKTKTGFEKYDYKSN